MASRKPAKTPARSRRPDPEKFPTRMGKAKLAVVPPAPSPTPQKGGERFAAPTRHVHAQKRGFNGKITTYDQTDEVDPHVAADLAMTLRISETLERHYPAHPWMVVVSHAQGVAQIKLPLVMKKNQAFILHLDKLAADPGLKAVIRAGGEILERHGMPRAGFSLTPFLEARAKGPYGPKPRPKIWMPEFATSARPDQRLVMPTAFAEGRPTA
jgi:hypothetical protein